MREIDHRRLLAQPLMQHTSELAKFVDMRNPGCCGQADGITVLNFDGYLKNPDLQKTNALVADYLDVCGAFEIIRAGSRELTPSN